MIRLFADDDAVTMLSSTPNDLHVSFTAISVSGGDVEDISAAFDDTFNPAGTICDGDHGGDRVDITNIVVSNRGTGTPRITITETVSDLGVVLFNAILPSGYSATMNGDGNTFTVAATPAAAASGVSKIVSGGDNVELSPTSGEGDVTVTVLGDGTGDLLAANNLSDLDDIDLAKGNLGLAPVATSGEYNDLGGAPAQPALSWDEANSHFSAGLIAFNGGTVKKNTTNSDDWQNRDPAVLDFSAQPDGTYTVFYDAEDNTLKSTTSISVASGNDHFPLANFSFSSGEISSFHDLSRSLYLPSLGVLDAVNDLAIKGVAGAVVKFFQTRVRNSGGSVEGDLFPNQDQIEFDDADLPFAGWIYADSAHDLQYTTTEATAFAGFPLVYVEITDNPERLVTAHLDRRKLWNLPAFLSSTQFATAAQGVLADDAEPALQSYNQFPDSDGDFAVDDPPAESMIGKRRTYYAPTLTGGHTLSLTPLTNVKNTDGSGLTSVILATSGDWVVLEGYDETTWRVVRAKSGVVDPEI